MDVSYFAKWKWKWDCVAPGKQIQKIACGLIGCIITTSKGRKWGNTKLSHM